MVKGKDVSEKEMEVHLVWFYGISTIVGYLMPNPVFYIHIKYMMCKYIL